MNEQEERIAKLFLNYLEKTDHQPFSGEVTSALESYSMFLDAVNNRLIAESRAMSIKAGSFGQ